MGESNVHDLKQGGVNKLPEIGQAPVADVLQDDLSNQYVTNVPMVYHRKQHVVGHFTLTV